MLLTSTENVYLAIIAGVFAVDCEIIEEKEWIIWGWKSEWSIAKSSNNHLKKENSEHYKP